MTQNYVDYISVSIYVKVILIRFFVSLSPLNYSTDYYETLYACYLLYREGHRVFYPKRMRRSGTVGENYLPRASCDISVLLYKEYHTQYCKYC